MTWLSLRERPLKTLIWAFDDELSCDFERLCALSIERFAEETARSFSVPDYTCETAAGKPEKNMST